MQVDVSSLARAEVGESLEYTASESALELVDLPGLHGLQTNGAVTKLADRLLLTGSAKATLPLTCARCLKQFEQTLQISYREEFAEHPSNEQFGYKNQRLNLAPMLRAVLLLSVPGRPLHDITCHGLCSACGKDLNDNPHTHAINEEPADNPFSGLKKLKD